MTGEPQVSFRQVSANGLSFRVATAGDGEPFILCLHGFPETALSWRHQLPAFAQAGYRVWAPNLRGYTGTSRPPALEAYHIGPLLDDVHALVEAAGVRRAILIGHDWGGLIAWFYGIRYADRIDRLVLLNAPHPACFQRELTHWRQRLRSLYALFFQLPWLPETVLRLGGGWAVGALVRRLFVHPERISADVLKAYRQQACEPQALTAMLNYYRAAGRGGGAADQEKAGYPPIHVPTLVIWGVQDGALVRENLDGLDEYVSDLTVLTVDTAGHFVHQDEPTLVTREILHWLGP